MSAARGNETSLLEKDGDELFDHYRHVLENLGKEKGWLGLIFAKLVLDFMKVS
ncbi:MAG: hypothetical protein QX199_04020 [Methylococcaceae bacterium]